MLVQIHVTTQPTTLRRLLPNNMSQQQQHDASPSSPVELFAPEEDDELTYQIEKHISKQQRNSILSKANLARSRAAEKEHKREQNAIVQAALLSESMESEFRSIMDEFDAEGTGTFDSSELQMIAIALGEPLSNEELAMILADLDPATKGVVSFDAFIKWWRSVFT